MCPIQLMLTALETKAFEVTLGPKAGLFPVWSELSVEAET